MELIRRLPSAKSATEKEQKAQRDKYCADGNASVSTAPCAEE